MEPQEQTHHKEESNKKMVINTPAAIVTAGVVIALALLLSGKGSTNNLNNKQAAPTGQKQVATTGPAQPVSVRSGDHVRGDLSTAQVVIVEYSDSDCPYCQRFHATMQNVMKKYGSKVAWVYRYFPLSIHPDANNEASALECVGQIAGNDKYWSYLDQIIDITISPDKSAPILKSMATSLGVDSNMFDTCIASAKTKATIDAQSAEAQALGAQGTPYSVAIGKNGNQVAIPGALPIEDVSKIIDGLLK